jgi:hypothetical protein
LQLGHPENIYFICKPLFFLYLPCHMLLQAFVIFLEEICIAEHKFVYNNP